LEVGRTRERGGVRKDQVWREGRRKNKERTRGEREEIRGRENGRK
jgi:hypothetical protein